jgi:4-amino-4-deoxy-L-arabinose transferase-like glycosyltransferase
VSQSTSEPGIRPGAWLERLGRAAGASKILWILLGISLLWRLLAWGLAVHYDVPLRGDEKGYYARAQAYAEVIAGLASWQWPDLVTWFRAYGMGKWTPLQPLLLSLGIVFGKSVASARLVVVLLSALTTPAIYLLTRQVAARRVALIAAGLHACYPTFVAYAHYLWAESAFSLCLVVTLLVALRSREAASDAVRLRRCGLSGLLAGVCFLIKPSGLLLMPAVPIWLCARSRFARPSLRAAAVFVAAWLIPWSLWSATASNVEGRFIPTMSNSGYATYLGNNPWIPPGVGTYVTAETQGRMRGAIDALTEQTGMSDDRAARRLAREEIAGRPSRFAARVMRRAQEHWFPDSFPLQHLYRGYYPPISTALGAFIGLVVVTCYLALVALAARGLLAPRSMPRDLKLLWLGVVLLLMVPSLMVVSRTRYHVPSLVILLPFAAVAIDRMRRPLPRYRELTWLAGTGCFLVVCANGVPNWIQHHVQPSSRYADLVRPLARIYKPDIHFVDRIAFRLSDGAPGRRITLSLPGGDAIFEKTGERVATWDATEESPVVETLIQSSLASAPLRVEIALEGEPARSRIVDALAAEAWRRWRPTGVPGVDYCWEPTPYAISPSVSEGRRLSAPLGSAP